MNYLYYTFQSIFVKSTKLFLLALFIITFISILRYQNSLLKKIFIASIFILSIIIYKKGLAHVRDGKLALGQEELELARQGKVSPQDINSYMQSFIRDLEQELEGRVGQNP